MSFGKALKEKRRLSFLRQKRAFDEANRRCRNPKGGSFECSADEDKVIEKRTRFSPKRVFHNPHRMIQ